MFRPLVNTTTSARSSRATRALATAVVVVPTSRMRKIEADDDAIETADDLDDEILEDEEDNVDLEEIADVASDEEET